MLDRLLADEGSEGEDDEAESDCSDIVDPLASEAVDRRLSPPSTVAAGLRLAALSLTPRMLRWARQSACKMTSRCLQREASGKHQSQG